MALGHRRLSILDLSEAGHQPMASTDGRLWIVFNGEIYNYRELRAELKSQGFSFQTETDTEVILAAYQYYGTDCLQHFNGMWAFALWDQRLQRLFCSRDRLGIKPFYFHHNAQRFIFASEIKSILQHPDVCNRLDEAVAYRFLAFGQTNLGQTSFFADIQQLEAGHFLLVEPQGLKKKAYWRLSGEIDTQIAFDEATSRFKKLFQDSIRLRLRSDVPIGTCLSGGLDSSSIVCMAHDLRQADQQILYDQQTFSSCFEEPRFDERPFIDAVIAQTQAQTSFVFPDPSTLLADLQALVVAQDEPFGSLSIFAQWCVMRQARQKEVKVLLDGQGADELLAGYGHDSLFWAELLRNQSFSLLIPEIQASWRKYGPKMTLRRFGRMIFPKQVADWEKSSQRMPFLQADFQARFHSQVTDDLQHIYASLLKHELYGLLDLNLSSLLRYEDRNSMAFSLEARVPFLDYRLVELVFSLPDHFLIQHGWSKWLLRQAMAGVLPEKVRWRQDKMGFVTPQQIWFRKGLMPLIEEILNEPHFAQSAYWDGPAIQRAYRRFLQGQEQGLAKLLWRFISFELWQRWVQAPAGKSTGNA